MSSPPGGLLSVGTSEVFHNVCSRDRFVTEHSGKAPRDGPVGFADFGSVSVVCLVLSEVTA